MLVLDTGLATQRARGAEAEHPDLQAAFSDRVPPASWTSIANPTEDFSDMGIMDEDVPDDVVLDPPDPSGDTERWLDVQAGHGTFISGIVARLAPDARVEIEAVINSWGLGDHATVAKGLQQARERLVDDGTPVAAVNMSLAGFTEDDRPHRFLLDEIREFARAHRVQGPARAGVRGRGGQRRHLPAGLARRARGGAGRRSAGQRPAGLVLQLRRLGGRVRSGCDGALDVLPPQGSGEGLQQRDHRLREVERHELLSAQGGRGGRGRHGPRRRGTRRRPSRS